jgi:hypothetical protein
VSKRKRKIKDRSDVSSSIKCFIPNFKAFLSQKQCKQRLIYSIPILFHVCLPFWRSSLPFWRSSFPFQRSSLPFWRSSLPFWRSSLPYWRSSLPFWRSSFAWTLPKSTNSDRKNYCVFRFLETIVKTFWSKNNTWTITERHAVY